MNTSAMVQLLRYTIVIQSPRGRFVGQGVSVGHVRTLPGVQRGSANAIISDCGSSGTQKTLLRLLAVTTNYHTVPERYHTLINYKECPWRYTPAIDAG